MKNAFLISAGIGFLNLVNFWNKCLIENFEWLKRSFDIKIKANYWVDFILNFQKGLFECKKYIIELIIFRRWNWRCGCSSIIKVVPADASFFILGHGPVVGWYKLLRTNFNITKLRRYVQTGQNVHFWVEIFIIFWVIFVANVVQGVGCVDYLRPFFTHIKSQPLSHLSYYKTCVLQVLQISWFAEQKFVEVKINFFEKLGTSWFFSFNHYFFNNFWQIKLIKLKFNFF